MNTSRLADMDAPLRRPLLIVMLTALVVGAVAFGAGPWGSAMADAAPTTVTMRFEVDRSAVPDWVTFHEITLLIPVGEAEACWAWGDGELLRLHHDRATGIVRVTTSASELLLTVRGDNVSPETIGPCQPATLKDDKAWAYSLTFDDGELNVYQYAYPLLQRYGYRAGIAVIGRWLDAEDAIANGYCSPVEVQTLLNHGWSVFNHSYSHWNSVVDITVEEAQRCQDAIYTHLNGYRATVFTVPYTNDVWEGIINENAAILGLHMMQLHSDIGARLEPLDREIHLAAGEIFHLGRNDIKRWIDESYNYFDQAHEAATSNPPEHVWVSLHGHNVLYSQDWCALAASTAYLYEFYGQGGTDEVWVAPVDEVLQYAIVRSAITIDESEVSHSSPGEHPREDQHIDYQQGANGYDGWEATYIMEWYPDRIHAGCSPLLLKGGEGGRSTVLMRVEPTLPHESAYVVRAVLSINAVWHSDQNDHDIMLYPLLRDWDQTATWTNASEGVPWEFPGATGSSVDRGSEPVDAIHIGECDGDLRWYHFDVTNLVNYWHMFPSENKGFVLTGRDDLSKGTNWAGPNYHDPVLRPVLRVDYRWPLPEATMTPTATPPPTIEPTLPPTATPTYTPTPTPEPTLPLPPVRVYLPLLHS